MKTGTTAIMKYFRWYNRNTRSVRKMLAGNILCQLVLVFCSLSMIIISKALIDCVTLSPEKAIFGNWFGKDTLAALAIMMFAIILLRLGTNALRSYLRTRSTILMQKEVKQMEFRKILDIMSDFRSRYHSGDMMNRINDDVSTLTATACSSIPNTIGAGLQFLCAFIYMVYLAPGLAWILVILIPVGIIGGKYVMHRTRQLTLNVRKDDSKIHSHIQESIQNLSNIKTMEYEDISWKKSGMLQDDLLSDTMKRLKFSISANTLVNATFSISYAIVFLWGTLGILHKTITFGTMTAFLQIIGQITRPLMEMSSDIPAILNSTASIDRLLEIEELPSETKGKNWIHKGETAGIRMEHITFAYEEKEGNVLEDFNWDFKPGSRTSIIGETGVGKSTLVKLLLSLEQPSCGKMTIYSDSSSYDINPSSRCNIAYVPQGNSLFSGSIRDNLLMGNPEASEEELRHALHIAAADFVFEMPDGLDSPCFEAGGGLSEGQAQRIAIARGILRPGTVLIMDEFSSALDPQTEERLMERLTGEFCRKTMIFITHREKVSEYCDSILRMDSPR